MPTRPSASRAARRLTATLVPGLVTALVAGLVAGVGPAAAAPPPPGVPERTAAGAGPEAADPSTGSTAAAVLAQAEALFSGRSGAATRRAQAEGAASGSMDATLVLTRLRQVASQLSPAGRQAAQALLERPTYHGTPETYPGHSYTVPEAPAVCHKVCVHYVTSTTDRVAATDADSNGVPDYVQTVGTVMGTVWAKEITSLGYRSPLSDAGLSDHGPDGRVDVYLENLPTGIYGYCAPDLARRKTSGYCVLDNDYSHADFPTNTPLQNLEVTAAHEFFHAVQFGYDSYEDAWLKEGTAVWMEDEVFNNVNDNRQYLATSQLHYPYVPLDYDSDSYTSIYGSWIFWRFLSEWAGRGSHDSPLIIKQVWTQAQGPRFSTVALQRVLQARRNSFARVYSTFGRWLRQPARYFREGAAYPAALLDGRFRLTKTHPSTGRRTFSSSHMTHSFSRFVPAATMSGRRWQLRVSVNMADLTRGSSARMVVYRRSGTTKVIPVHLGRRGNGVRTFGFSTSSVKYLELDMVNASIRFHCGQGTGESCGGVPYDDGLAARFTATAFR